MNKSLNIVVTGAAGFIGSCLVSFLNKAGYENLILVDDFSKHQKDVNLEGKIFSKKIEREEFFELLEKENLKIDFIYHLGARTDTTEFDYSIHEHLNVEYSKKIWNYCVEKNVPLVYASSAATYGSGELGYKDDENVIPDLKPLNPYGVSKNEFEKAIDIPFEKLGKVTAGEIKIDGEDWGNIIEWKRKYDEVIGNFMKPDLHHVHEM